ncbi:hypothetical protein PILCRDRAFT_706351 [Piloderma croceum F 1598]|uniref:Uncharacterized protein n=1 Tax=Piloderma croceum (strain F 1598) TaxID=765440 RepID=A0A0C3AK91_PILCF|nr:hypothetical protein PILCRDRAFT_706351 [Piloderma croceum F 1598]
MSPYGCAQRSQHFEHQTPMKTSGRHRYVLSVIILSSLLTPEAEGYESSADQNALAIYKRCCLFISIPAILFRLPYTASMNATIHRHVSRPILPQYSENRTHLTSESHTAARSKMAAWCNRDFLIIYIIILALTIFSVPIGHGVLHSHGYYRHVSILSSLKVGAVGGGVICAPALVLFELCGRYLIKHCDRSPKPVDESIDFVALLILMSLLLLLAFRAGPAGAACVGGDEGCYAGMFSD